MLHTKKQVTWTIKIDNETALYLKRVLQNPILNESPSDEDFQDKKFRKIVWDTLPSFEELMESNK